MSRNVLVLSVALLAAGAAGAYAVPRADAPEAAVAAPASDRPTVGDFVLRYASALGMAGPGARSEDARAALRKAGAIGPESLDLSAPLTEGDVIRLSGKQLKITTNAPERAFSQERFAEFFDVFGPDLRQIARRRNEAGLSMNGLVGDPAALVPGEDNPGKGRGKGKGKGTSPHEP
jgi:hypothetical protein